MITIGDILHPRQIDLALNAPTQEEAIFHVASLLKDDPRIKDWTGFYNGLKSSNPCVAAGAEFQICIPHVRTNAVSDMVMAVGRSIEGIPISSKKKSAKIHYIFVAGVPTALAADYLRIIGALARVFSDAAAEMELRKTERAEDFLAILSAHEMKL
jgi:mannitol/fructose-specific phosphotransferase system IIA component (Ntr-type)